MISFTLITTSPVALRNNLIARNVLKQDAQGNLVGVYEGLEWVEVPNIIITTLGTGKPLDVGYIPPVMDTRRCYLVKLVRVAESNETAGLVQGDTDARGQFTLRSLLQRTKLGQWIMANSVADTLTSADGRSWPSRRVGTNFWGVISDDFGVWQ